MCLCEVCSLVCPSLHILPFFVEQMASVLRFLFGARVLIAVVIDDLPLDVTRLFFRERELR